MHRRGRLPQARCCLGQSWISSRYVLQSSFLICSSVRQVSTRSLPLWAKTAYNTWFIHIVFGGTVLANLVRAKISALGTYVPPRLLTNTDLEKMVETSNEWILERTGIRQRH